MRGLLLKTARFSSLAAALKLRERRQHWTVRDATDQGFPLKGEWRIKFGAKKPRLESGTQCWRADAGSKITLTAAYSGKATTARVYWKRLDEDRYDARKSMTVELKPDGAFHSYTIQLTASPEYRGLVTSLAIDPVSAPRPGEEIAIRSIVLER